MEDSETDIVNILTFVLALQSTLQKDQSTSITLTLAPNAGAASRCTPTFRSISVHIFLTLISSVPPANVTSPARVSYAYIGFVRRVRSYTSATSVSILLWRGMQSVATC